MKAAATLAAMALAALFGSLGSWRVAPARADEVWDDFRPGDLVFQEADTPEGEAMAAATGSRLTHVGLTRDTGGGVYVVEATAEEGVFEAPVEDFIARGRKHRYAVYRLPPRGAPNWYSAILAAFEHYNAPYDRFYLEGEDAFYDAELVRKSFEAVGVELGKLEPLGALASDPAVKARFLQDWRNHPRCRARGLDRDACWASMKAQMVVTPASLAADPKLTLVFSNFD